MRVPPTKTQRIFALAFALAAPGILAGCGAPVGEELASQSAAVTSRITIGPGKSSCPPGYLCLWALNDFTGSGYGFFNTEIDYATLPAPLNNINNNSWSFYNNGNNDDVRLYRDSRFLGDQFVLCRKEAIGRLPSNLEVMPPSTPGQGWKDQVSSHKWGRFCS